MGVRVKPLAWRAHPYGQSTIGECAIADAAFSHRYQAQRDPWAPTYMAFLHPAPPISESTLWWESKGHATIDAAKAAAQADYETRILAALEPATDARAEARIAELVEECNQLEAMARGYAEELAAMTDGGK